MIKWIKNLLRLGTVKTTIADGLADPLNIALGRLKEFRARGETFKLSGATFTVLSFTDGHSGFGSIPSQLPSMNCVYTDNLGVIHNRRFHAWEISALRAVNPDLEKEKPDV